MSEPQDIAAFWSSKPMTYGRQHGAAEYESGTQELGSRAFFEAADRDHVAIGLQQGFAAQLHGDLPFFCR